MNETSQAPGPCAECGHSEEAHRWENSENHTWFRVMGCGHMDRRPGENDEPEVRFSHCHCEQYLPMRHKAAV